MILSKGFLCHYAGKEASYEKIIQSLAGRNETFLVILEASQVSMNVSCRERRGLLCMENIEMARQALGFCRNPH